MEELEKESAAFCSTSIETSTRDKEHFDDFIPEFALHVGDLQEIKYLLDSGCSRHITGNKHDLANYNDFDEEDNDESHMVTLADKSIVKAVGKGNLNVHLKDSKGEKVPVTFKDVLYIPKMKRLISVGQLTQAGGEVTFKEKSAVLRVSGRSFVFGTKVGKLYNMNWCYFATAVENSVERTEEIKKEINEKTETDSEPVGVITEENEDDQDHNYDETTTETRLMQLTQTPERKYIDMIADRQLTELKQMRDPQKTLSSTWN